MISSLATQRLRIRRWLQHKRYATVADIAIVTYLFVQKKAAEKRELEAAKQDVVRVDDLLTFRQFTKKAADDVIDVRIPNSGLKRCHFYLTNPTV
jgi:hypothetical protein